MERLEEAHAFFCENGVPCEILPSVRSDASAAAEGAGRSVVADVQRPASAGSSAPMAATLLESPAPIAPASQAHAGPRAPALGPYRDASASAHDTVREISVPVPAASPGHVPDWGVAGQAASELVGLAAPLSGATGAQDERPPAAVGEFPGSPGLAAPASGSSAAPLFEINKGPSFGPSASVPVRGAALRRDRAGLSLPSASAVVTVVLLVLALGLVGALGWQMSRPNAGRGLSALFAAETPKRDVPSPPPPIEFDAKSPERGGFGVVMEGAQAYGDNVIIGFQLHYPQGVEPTGDILLVFDTGTMNVGRPPSNVVDSNLIPGVVVHSHRFVVSPPNSGRPTGARPTGARPTGARPNGARPTGARPKTVQVRASPYVGPNSKVFQPSP